LGKTYEDRFLLVATDLRFDSIFPGMGPVAYIFDPHEWVIVMHLPEVVRVVFRLDPEEDLATALAEQSVRARVERFLGETRPFAIRSVSSYNVHQRVASRFREGRVVLAGDAAHVNNPTGGMGMNSGIHDAHRLAQALVAEVKTGDDRDVDGYAEERRFIATKRVQADSDRGYGALVIADPEAREARNRELREAAKDPAKAREYLLRSAMLENRINDAAKVMA
jgi:3-(3-hydroxy-phenyl)propionate hydroxylase